MLHALPYPHQLLCVCLSVGQALPILLSTDNHLFCVCSKLVVASVNVPNLCLEIIGNNWKLSSLHVGQVLLSAGSRWIHVWQKLVPQQVIWSGSRSIRRHTGHFVWKALVGGSTNSHSYPPKLSSGVNFSFWWASGASCRYSSASQFNTEQFCWLYKHSGSTPFAKG